MTIDQLPIVGLKYRRLKDGPTFVCLEVVWTTEDDVRRQRVKLAVHEKAAPTFIPINEFGMFWRAA